ncbi:MAG: hypothetical protein KGJ07_00450 [Patescibacteria group bacterium]|nr:hypothetical protein [Patescibacteria group bacterium]
MAERHGGKNGPGRPTGGTPSERQQQTPITMYMLGEQARPNMPQNVLFPERRHPLLSTHVLMMRNTVPGRDSRQDVASVMETTAVLADGHGPNGKSIATRIAREFPTALNINLLRPVNLSTGQRIYQAVRDIAETLGESETADSGAAVAAARITNGNLLSVVPSDAEVIVIRSGLPISLPPPKLLSDTQVQADLARRAEYLEGPDAITRRGGVFIIERGEVRVRTTDGTGSYGLAHSFGDTGSVPITALNIPIRENREYAEIPLIPDDLVVLASDGIRRFPVAVDLLTVLLTNRDHLGDMLSAVRKDPQTTILERIRHGLVGLEYANVDASEIIRRLKDILSNTLNTEWPKNSNIDKALFLLKEYIAGQSDVIPDDITVMVLKPTVKAT